MKTAIWLCIVLNLSLSLLFSQTPVIHELLDSIERGDKENLINMQLPDLHFNETRANRNVTAQALTWQIKRGGKVIFISNAVVADSLFIGEKLPQKNKLVFINCRFDKQLVIDKVQIAKHLAFIGCRFKDDVRINDISVKNLTFFANRMDKDFSFTAGYLQNRMDEFIFVLNYAKSLSIEAQNLFIPCPYSGTITLQKLTIASNYIDKVFISAVTVKNLSFITYNIVDDFKIDAMTTSDIILVKYNSINRFTSMHLENGENTSLIFLMNQINTIHMAQNILKSCGFIGNTLNKLRLISLSCRVALQISANRYKNNARLDFYGVDMFKFSFRLGGDSIQTLVADTLKPASNETIDFMKILSPNFQITDSTGKKLIVALKRRTIKLPEDNNRYVLNFRSTVITPANWFVHFDNLKKTDGFYRINSGDSVLSIRHEIYTSIQKAYANQGKWSQADACFYEWKEFERTHYMMLSQEGFLTRFAKTVFHYLNWISCGYGIKPLRVFPFAFMIIFIFAVFYYLTPQPISNLEYHLVSPNKIKNKLSKMAPETLQEIFTGYDFDFDKHKQDLIDDIVSSLSADELIEILGMQPKSRWNMEYFWNCFYFSFSTFTTVGIGDWYPSGKLNKAIVMLEGSLGWLCLGLFITTYANILLR